MIKRYPVVAFVLALCSSTARGNDELTSQWLLQYKKGNTTERPHLNLDPVRNHQDALNWITEVVSGNSTVSDVQLNCTTKDGEQGICVPYYLCHQETWQVIEDGEGLIEMRSKDCSHYLQACCKDDKQLILKNSADNSIDQQPEDKEPTEPTTEHVKDALEGFNFSEFFGTLAKESAEPKNQSLQCGWNNPELFILKPSNPEMANKGNYANYGDFPWMVALLKKSEATVWIPDNYMGGGSLIHPSVVVTVAHKVEKVLVTQIKCRAGEWDTQTVLEKHEIQERDVKKIVLHEDYFRRSVYNDIALVFLEQPFDLTAAPHIGTACLANLLPSDGRQCYSMGWGKDAKTNLSVNILKKASGILFFDDWIWQRSQRSIDQKVPWRKIFQILRAIRDRIQGKGIAFTCARDVDNYSYVKLPLVAHEKCQNLLRNTKRLTSRFELHPSLTCAGGEAGVDTCKGDGGSSLVCEIVAANGRTRYAVVGLVAYGLSCGRQDVPALYANVPHLYQWVNDKMAADGYGHETYTY